MSSSSDAPAYSAKTDAYETRLKSSRARKTKKHENAEKDLDAYASFKCTFKRGNETVPAYVFGKAKSAGVVCLQEWWGVTADILDQAKYVAESQRYRVVVPDLYRGKLSMDAKEADHMMKGLDWKGAVEDVRAAAAFLRAEGSKRVAVTGFCMGGALTLACGVLASDAV
eukprot:g2411.t1